MNSKNLSFQVINCLNSVLCADQTVTDDDYYKAVLKLNNTEVLESFRKSFSLNIADQLRIAVEKINWRRVFTINPSFELDDFYKKKLQCKLKVSVIIPVFNVEKYLIDCLESICKQTYSNIEIICVDDGSTDKSLQILTTYQNRFPEKIRLINKKNEGVAVARNSGLSVATGYYIYFLDSDDLLDDQTIEKVCGAIDSSIDFVVHGVKVIALDKELNFDAADNEAWFNRYRKKTGAYLLDRNIKKELASVCYSKLYKHSFFFKYNIRFPSKIIHEDEVFLWSYMIHCTRYYYLDEQLYCYRRRNSGIMAARLQSRQALDGIRFPSEIYWVLKKNGKLKDFSQYSDKYFINQVPTLLTKIESSYINEALQLVHTYVWNVHHPDQSLRNFYWRVMNNYLPKLLK